MRYIEFTLEGYSSDILVRLEEQLDGTILVTLTSDGEPIDIRGLFFDVNDASLISSLSVAGIDVSGSQFMDEGVIDLGRGVNMHGEGRGPFDVGVSFGTPGQGQDVVSSTTLVLSSSEGPLTLDLLSLVDFGVRVQGGAPPKIVEIAPAAPDANDDLLEATEDVTSFYTVLDNDTDADGTADFTIVSVTDPVHGTATISEDGLTIIYTPDLNYSGTDEFTYDMSDGHGGGDSATGTINVIAVADAPTLTVTTAAGSDVNHIQVTVTAAVTDLDGSEYVDRFVFSGLPAGASIVDESDLVYNPSTTDGTMVQTFTIALDPNTDMDFDLGVTAVSRESSNASEATTSTTVGVLVDANSNSFTPNFLAANQSIWGAGNALEVVDDRFIGIDFDPARQTFGDIIYGYADLDLYAGLQSTLTFDGGSIDANAPWNVAIDTTYNHTTDVLLIESGASLVSAGVSFTTSGPSGSYVLDFIFNYAVTAGLGLDIGIYDETLFDFSASGANTINILLVDSEDLTLEFTMPYGLTITLTWPDVDTASLVTSSGSTFTSLGQSLNFLDINLDLDQALSDIFFSGENPFDASFSIDIGVVEAGGTFEALDVDLNAGMNFIQEFSMALGNLAGTLTFENDATLPWNFSDIVLANASTYDADGDGIIEFELTLDQQAELTNETSLGFDWGYSVALLQANGDYDAGVGELSYSDDWSLAPVWTAGQTFPIVDISLYTETFALDFAVQTIVFNANDTVLG